MCSPWLTHMLLSKDLSQRLAAYMDVSSLLNTVVCSRQLYRECGNSCAVWSAHSQCKPLSFKPDCAVDAITRATALDAYKAIKAIQSSDSVAQLESLLFLHPAAQLSAGVARSGLLRLNMLVMDGAVERVSAWQLGFAEKCVWLMRQHVQSAECLVEGLQCLVGLGRPVFRNNSSVDSAAGGTLLVTPATTMSYTLSAAPIFDNCSMLGDVVFEAMRLHPRNPEVVATALRAATNLCLSYKQRCWLLSAGLMDMVLWAVIEYSTDARVVERCLSCAINLSARSSDNSGCHWKDIVIALTFMMPPRARTPAIYDQTVLLLSNLAVYCPHAICIPAVLQFLEDTSSVEFTISQYTMALVHRIQVKLRRITPTIDRTRKA